MRTAIPSMVHYSEVLFKVSGIHVWDESADSLEISLKSIGSWFRIPFNCILVLV